MQTMKRKSNEVCEGKAGFEAHRMETISSSIGYTGYSRQLNPAQSNSSLTNVRKAKCFVAKVGTDQYHLPKHCMQSRQYLIAALSIGGLSLTNEPVIIRLHLSLCFSPVSL